MMTVTVPEWFVWLIAVYGPLALVLDALNAYYKRKLAKPEEQEAYLAEQYRRTVNDLASSEIHSALLEADCPTVDRGGSAANLTERLAARLQKIIDLCALGDVDESTEVYGWGDEIAGAQAEIAEVEGLRLHEPDVACDAPPPIDMVLYCPFCHEQHVDESEWCYPNGEPKECAASGMGCAMTSFGPNGEVQCAYCGRGTWNNPPHRSHLCHSCGRTWRPADVATNGVVAIKTKGKNDTEGST